MLTPEDEKLMRTFLREDAWSRLVPANQWRVEEISTDGLGLLVFVGTYGRDRGAGKLGALADHPPWHRESVRQERLMLDRDRACVTLVPDSRSSKDFFLDHVESLPRGRRGG